ncbi:hypothetical protein ASZ78_015209 [Callipepla squamata]|uniref:Choline/carnitine acyltransferase domain-containing protein n=1 Tax=Callipepla squamata TaxID=9009 RepID=A0A226NJX5_CALSU|nr:hypothetical protein ASZ78_015209 [Callipepla squamata]
MEKQVLESSEERTFQYQDSLPPLPVPPLDESLSKYLDSVKPFINQEEYQRTEEIVKKFENGIGRELHQKLLERAKTRRNWLEEWWLNVAYLDLRISTQINCNMGGPGPYIEHYWPPKEGTQIERACINIWHTLKYWELLRAEKVPIERSGNAVLDMSQFRMLFNTCKVPGLTRDSLCNYFKTEVQDDHDCGDGLTAGLVDLSFSNGQCKEKLREYLISLDPKNLAHLEKIQQSLFVVSLDDASPHATPEDYTEITRLGLAGDPTVRWGDKSYNSIFFSNGTSSAFCDHSPFDAMALITMLSSAEQKIIENEGKWKGSDKVRDIPWPEELVFTVDQKIIDEIGRTKEIYYEKVSDLQLACYAFTSFGKALIKKRKLHPDTFVQLALQLAYYKCHGRPGCCYETAMTRRFYHGRTETIRPCTVEAVQWCKSMLDHSASSSECLRLMHVAFAKHNRMRKDCENGRGFDRHLLGLLLIAQEQGLPVPELFVDPAFTASGGGGNFVLSTSLTGYTRFSGCALPMVHHGYGFFYAIRDDR